MSNDVISFDPKEFLWTTKYRPSTVAEVILPADLKATFQGYVDDKNIPNLLLCGGPGSGKTTVAKAMCSQLNIDWLMINGSMNGNIDTLRTTIQDFASTVSLNNGRKMVIVDEADYLTPQTQAAMRGFMEDFASNCGFILTCNLKNRVIDALHSRCAVIDFVIPTTERSKLAMEFLARIESILKAEKVEYQESVLIQLISNHFPDWRRVLSELQRYSRTGAINTGVLAVGVDDKSFRLLIADIKGRKWNEMRKWVGEHRDMEPIVFLRKFYDQAQEVVVQSTIPALVLLLAETQYKLQFSADSEICLVAFLTQVMSEVQFK